MRKCISLLTTSLIISLSIPCLDVFAADWMQAGTVELTLENEPKAEDIATIKIKATVFTDIPNNAVAKAIIYCGIPDELELINNKNYLVERKVSTSNNYFNLVTLYEGPMKKNETKEIIFRVRIPDEKKHTVFGGVTGGIDKELEINFGEAEPPELEIQKKEITAINEEMPSIISGIKQSIAGKHSSVEFYECTLQPLRTELKIRTKNNPYVTPPYNPKEIPLRYLVYTEDEGKEVNVTIELPEGLILINGQNYKTTTTEREGEKITIIALFEGPMHLKECKAFYFKLRADKKEHFKIRVKATIITNDDKKFMAENFQDIELGKILY
jgi:hypothetical protein